MGHRIKIFSQGNMNVILYQRYTKCKWIVMRDTENANRQWKMRKYNFKNLLEM